jgi:hypothetical protein
MHVPRLLCKKIIGCTCVYCINHMLSMPLYFLGSGQYKLIALFLILHIYGGIVFLWSVNCRHTLNDLVGVSLELQAQTWLLKRQGFIPQTERPRGYISSLHRNYYLPDVWWFRNFLTMFQNRNANNLCVLSWSKFFSCSKLHQKHWPPSFCIWDSEVFLAHAEELVCTLEKNERCSKEVARGG